MYRRSFNPPTGLDKREQVWLVVERLSEGATVSFNDAELGRVLAPGTVAEFEITTRLAVRNQIVIELPSAGPINEDELPFDTRLEIRLAPAANETRPAT